jgi:hypothetical protein
MTQKPEKQMEKNQGQTHRCHNRVIVERFARGERNRQRVGENSAKAINVEIVVRSTKIPLGKENTKKHKGEKR